MSGRKFGGADKCAVCTKSVYAMDRLDVNGKILHKTCMKCAHCKKSLAGGAFASLEDAFYCKPHFRQLFAVKGNYNSITRLSAAGMDPSAVAEPSSHSPGGAHVSASTKPAAASASTAGTSSKSAPVKTTRVHVQNDTEPEFASVALRKTGARISPDATAAQPSDNDKRTAEPISANANGTAEIEKARAEIDVLMAELAKAKAECDALRAENEAMKLALAEKADAEASNDMAQSVADAKAEAERAMADMEKAKAEAENAKADMEKAKAEAENAKAAVASAKAAAEKAKAEAEAAMAVAEKAKATAAQSVEEDLDDDEREFMRTHVPVLELALLGDGDDASSKQSWQVREEPVTVGRDADVAQVVLEDASVSSRHARIELVAAERKFYVTDLSSSNGTHVRRAADNVKCALESGVPFALAANDLLYVADTRLQVVKSFLEPRQA